MHHPSPHSRDSLPHSYIFFLFSGFPAISHVYRVNSIKKSQVDSTSQTLAFRSSHRVQFNTSLYEFPFQASNLYLQWYFMEPNFYKSKLDMQLLQFSQFSMIAKNYTCNFFIELTPVLELDCTTNVLNTLSCDEVHLFG